MIEKLNKFLVPIICLVVILKLITLPSGSYPFDFATYVYQARSFFEWGINPLFYWNKGMPLLAIFYSCYSAYQFVTTQFFGSLENTMILHGLYKLPFLFSDLLIAVLIKRIVENLTRKTTLGLYAATLWIINPFIFWVTEFQGSYAIIAACTTMAALYCLLIRKMKLSVILLAIGTAIYYYPLIFLPFFLLHAYRGKNAIPLESVLCLAGLYILTLFACYLPFVLNPQLLLDLIGSLLHHSAPDSSAFVEIVRLPDFSLLKFPYFLATGELPTNIGAPWIFNIAKLLTLVGLFGVTILVIKRFWEKAVSASTYTTRGLIVDLVTVLTLFLVLVGKFQDHYLVWLLPVIIVAGVAIGQELILVAATFVSIIALVMVVSSGNLGIYLLDILPFGTVNLYWPTQEQVQALAGWTVLSILAAIALLVRTKIQTLIFSKLSSSIIAASVVIVIAIGYTSVYAIIASLGVPNAAARLGSDKNVYAFAYSSGEQKFIPQRRETQIVNGTNYGFELDSLGQIQANAWTNSTNSAWFFYSYGGSDAPSVQVKQLTSGVNQNNFLEVVPSSTESKAQINMGGNDSRLLAPIASADLYRASVKRHISAMSKESARASIRFADNDRKIISGSDIRLTESQQLENGWELLSAEFIAPKGARFVEILFTVDDQGRKSFGANASVKIDDMKVERLTKIDRLVITNSQPKDNADSIRRQILQRESARYFQARLKIDAPDRTQQVSGVTLGSCSNYTRDYSEEPDTFIAVFDASCLSKTGYDNVSANLTNFTKMPPARLSLVHSSTTSQKQVNFNHSAYLIFILLGIAGAFGALGILLKLLFRDITDDSAHK